MSRSSTRKRRKAQAAITALERSFSESVDGEYRACTECGSTFWLAGSEIDWYQVRDMKPPKRCPSCRASRRNQ